MVTYRSKIGLELIVPISIIFGAIVMIMITNKALLGIFVILPVIAFVVHMLLTTYYVVEGSMLTIKCGFLYNLKVDIGTIKKIKETNNALSSPAASLDRLEVSYGKFDDVMISPKDKAGFINHLIEINPSIEVVYKQLKSTSTVPKA
jgi:hypothetical protein